VWNQAFDLPIYSLDHIIKLTCFDKELILDDTVGETLIRVKALLNSEGKRSWVSLYFKKEYAGEILIQSTWKAIQTDVFQDDDEDGDLAEKGGIEISAKATPIEQVEAWISKQPAGQVKLVVTVIKGRLIRITEAIGKMDPYVLIEYNGAKYKTDVKDEAGKNPEWNQDLVIPLASLRDTVKLSCHESDYVKDDFIGDMETQIASFINLNGLKKWIPINYKNSKSADILIQTKLQVSEDQQLPTIKNSRSITGAGK
jgi:Ca2+-dependent lipid-binding protein